MSKSESVFACQKCGHLEKKWAGRCPSCGGWSTLVEERAGPKRVVTRGERPVAKAVRITDVDVESVSRVALGLGDMDRVLGGGLVPGSLVLIGGEPGVGKSTLLLQAAAGVVNAAADRHVLYVSAEESAAQVRLRAQRLGLTAGAAGGGDAPVAPGGGGR